jgi:hypothetical protein
MGWKSKIAAMTAACSEKAEADDSVGEAICLAELVDGFVLSGKQGSCDVRDLPDDIFWRYESNGLRCFDLASSGNENLFLLECSLAIRLEQKEELGSAFLR